MSLISGAIHQHAKDCCVVQKNGFFLHLLPFWPPSVQSENDQTGTPMFVFVTIPGGITIIMPTIIIIHSSKYSVLFRFISSRCTWIRYSDVQYFPIHVLSMFFFQNVHSCQFWSAANIFPFISMPIWTYELLLISDLQNRIPPDSGVRADNRTRRGEVSLFLIFFSDLMSDVFCIDITLLVL